MHRPDKHRLLSQSSFSHLKESFSSSVLVKNEAGYKRDPGRLAEASTFLSTPPAVIYVTIPASDRNPILQQYQHQPTGSPAQWGWLQDYCRNSSIRLSLSHTHISLSAHTHTHQATLLLPSIHSTLFCRIAVSTLYLFIFFLQWLLYLVSSPLPHSCSIPDAWALHLLGLPEIPFVWSRDQSQSRKTFRGIVWWKIWIKHDSGAFTCSAVIYSFTMKCRLDIRWQHLHIHTFPFTDGHLLCRLNSGLKGIWLQFNFFKGVAAFFF